MAGSGQEQRVQTENSVRPWVNVVRGALSHDLLGKMEDDLRDGVRSYYTRS